METTTSRYEEIAEEKDLDVDAFEGFCDNQHITEDEAEDAVEDFRDAYIGKFGSVEEFAEEWVNHERLRIPHIILGHIDWQGLWNCELRHDFYEIEGHFFRNI